jgi:hypothetical protein
MVYNYIRSLDKGVGNRLYGEANTGQQQRMRHVHDLP